MIVNISKITLADDPTITSPLELSEVKAHLRIPLDEDYDDTYLISLINAAINYVEIQINRKLTLHKVEYFLSNTTPIVYPPYGLNSITQAQTTERTLAKPTDYVAGVDKIQFQKELRNVTVFYECGYRTLPPAIKQALLLIIGTMYEVRADITYGVQTYKSMFSSEQLLIPFRILPL